MLETIILRSLRTTSHVGTDAWDRDRPQPLIISIYHCGERNVPTTVDNLDHTLSYGTIAKSLLELSQNKKFEHIHDVTEEILLFALRNKWPFQNLTVHARLPKALPTAVGSNGSSDGEGQGVSFQVEHNSKGVISQTLTLGTFPVTCIIGLNPPERIGKQTILLQMKMSYDVVMSRDSAMALRSGSLRDICRQVGNFVHASEFKTVESLAFEVSKMVLQSTHEACSDVQIKIEKPYAITFADGAGVEVHMSRAELDQNQI